MDNKTMLAALAVSAALFALPAFASGQEIHLEGISEFVGNGSASGLTTEGEPTFTCETTHVNGTVETGGTTGSMSLDITGCHSTLFGFTVKCHSNGSALDNTVKMAATFHLITFKEKPAVLTTASPVTLVCAGFSNVTISGSGIATITSPTCGQASNLLKLSFNATGPTQEDRLYTGVNYNLKLQTGGGSQIEAATAQTWTIESAVPGKLNCT
jgi:hypothetical protein